MGDDAIGPGELLALVTLVLGEIDQLMSEPKGRLRG
jgi:hypothetical protein